MADIPAATFLARLRRASTATTALTATLAAFLVLGYHPYAEDGGIYSAAVAARLDPTRFPWDRAFVVAHTRFALFVPLVVAWVRVTHLSPAVVLLLLHTLGIVALVAAGMHLAHTCLPRAPRWTTALSLAIGMGLPVAGTSLYAVDPYCTARSLTSPLLLFALSFALRRRWLWCSVLWCAAAALHPLMALWSLMPLLLAFVWTRKHRKLWLAATCLVLFAAGILLQHGAAPDSAQTRAAVATRAYWFLSQWRWYEIFGAVAPPSLLLLASAGRHDTLPLRLCARTCTVATAVALLFALCFARSGAGSFAVARLQPLRTLHLVFLTFLALAGPALWLRLRTKWQHAAALACMGIAATSVFAMERSTFPHTRHLEWPGLPASNAWEDAFTWCNQNLPTNALVALPADYINLPGEDSHGFRAAARRSTLPDVVKDAGVVAVLPELSSAWRTGVAATRDLAGESDTRRRAELLPLGVSWVVLPAKAATHLQCPFVNTAAEVCQLQQD